MLALILQFGVFGNTLIRSFAVDVPLALDIV